MASGTDIPFSFIGKLYDRLVLLINGIAVIEKNLIMLRIKRSGISVFQCIRFLPVIRCLWLRQRAKDIAALCAGPFGASITDVAQQFAKALAVPFSWSALAYAISEVRVSKEEHQHPPVIRIPRVELEFLKCRLRRTHLDCLDQRPCGHHATKQQDQPNRCRLPNRDKEMVLLHALYLLASLLSGMLPSGVFWPS